MTYGLTPAGFTRPTLAEIQADIAAAWLLDVDAELDLSSDEPFGQLLAIQAERESLLWELLQTAFNAFDDSNAAGSLLISLAALTGTVVRVDTHGTVKVTCNLDPGVSLGTTHTVSDPSDHSNEWALKAPFSVPTGATAAANYSLTFQSTSPGAIPAIPGALTRIVTPVAGWNSATNPAAATPGYLAESEASLRIRRRKELRASGASNPPALKAALEKLGDGVQALVQENLTNTVDANGLPAHSFRAIVWDGISSSLADADIRQTIFAHLIPGIQPVGSNSGMVADSFGELHDVPFSRATGSALVIALSVSRGPDFPSDGVAQIKSALLALAATQAIGAPAIYVKYLGAASSVAGVDDIPVFTINSVAANYAVGALSVATLLDANITVTLL